MLLGQNDKIKFLANLSHLMKYSTCALNRIEALIKRNLVAV